jgi:hypothetical protein
MQKGVKVLITDGCMKGLTGELCSDLKVNSKRVKINIDSIKSFACVEIPRGYLSLCG